ncbi:MAG TPA: polysaccharide deacetylase family protein [Flavobacteriales bacterium]
MSEWRAVNGEGRSTAPPHSPLATLRSLDPEIALWNFAQRLMRLDRRLLCRVPHAGNDVFLTFDDGPDPVATPWVLDTLARHHAKATFFLIGRNAEAHPQLVQRIRHEGHTIGNHTWDHADAWRTPRADYLGSVERGHALTGSTLFRPPYGHLTPGLVRTLHRRHRIVQWDVIAGDFKADLDALRMAERVVSRTRPGSIVVFHDTQRCLPKLEAALPGVLITLAKQGMHFRPLS